MWFYSGHANIYVSKGEARSERITGFGCDTGFGARDVDLLLALPELACVTLNQPHSPLCYSWFEPFFWKLAALCWDRFGGKKELFNSPWRSECLGDVVIVANYGNLSSGGHLQNLYRALHTVLGLLESALSCCNANNGLHSVSSSSNFLWISPANLYLNKQ